MPGEHSEYDVHRPSKMSVWAQEKVLVEEVDLGVVSFGTRKENIEQEEKQAKDRSQKN